MPQSGQFGNAGGGRKSAYEEHNKSAAINKLWEKLRNKIDKNEELTEFEEKLVAPLLSKTIRTDVSFSGDPLQLIVKRSQDANQDEGDTTIQPAG